MEPTNPERMNHFPDELQFRDGGYHNGSRWLILTHYYRVITSMGLCTVPTGFRTDGASIPRAFWPIIGPMGPYLGAAVLHDYLYSNASNGRFTSTRKQADDLFLEAMFNLGVLWIHRNPIHLAVRLFGWRSYKKR